MSDDDPYQAELLNVPHYEQGAFDSLCTYYTGAMMLAALYPAFAVRFGQAKKTKVKTITKRMSDDPIISNYSNEEHPRILARWFYHGEWIEKLVSTLNAIMERDPVADAHTEFEYRQGNPSSDNTFRRIAESINDGLPVMLGWDAEDYGCHAVLVTGYRKGREDWLITNDPGGGGEVSWNSLKAQQGRRFEVGLCTSHCGLRPMKRTTVKQGEVPIIGQWSTSAQKYEAIG